MTSRPVRGVQLECPIVPLTQTIPFRVAFTFALILTLLAFAACDRPSGSPEIRLVNQGSIPLENVLVRFPSQTETYGVIPPNGATDYRRIERSYSLAYIEAAVAGQRAVLQPIDYVGDKLLRPGRYTFALAYNEQAQSDLDRLRFEFIRD